MLFVALPDSTNSLRLMVIVLLSGGGSFSAAGLDADPAGAAAPLSVGSFGVVAAAGSSGPIDGGSEGSTEGSSDGRVTITVSPASFAIPPASARTSRMVTGRSAWYTMACCTAPTTVMGLLFLSFTLTLTCG